MTSEKTEETLARWELRNRQTIFNGILTEILNEGERMAEEFADINTLELLVDRLRVEFSPEKDNT